MSNELCIKCKFYSTKTFEWCDKHCDNLMSRYEERQDCNDIFQFIDKLHKENEKLKDDIKFWQNRASENESKLYTMNYKYNKLSQTLYLSKQWRMEEGGGWR